MHVDKTTKKEKGPYSVIHFHGSQFQQYSSKMTNKKKTQM